MRPPHPLTAAGLLSLALTPGLAACGGGSRSDTINPSKVQDYIRANLARRSVASPDVSCPGGVRIVPGRTFECTATSGTERVVFTLRVVDRKGGVSVVSFRPG